MLFRFVFPFLPSFPNLCSVKMSLLAISSLLLSLSDGAVCAVWAALAPLPFPQDWPC